MPTFASCDAGCVAAVIMSLIEINFLRPPCGTGLRFQIRRASNSVRVYWSSIPRLPHCHRYGEIFFSLDWVPAALAFAVVRAIRAGGIHLLDRASAGHKDKAKFVQDLG